jgi:hypothetical protein
MGVRQIDSGLVILPCRLIDFLPQHPDLPWRRNAEPDLVAAHAKHGHDNIVADGETLAESATQYQHQILLSEKIAEAKLGSAPNCLASAPTSPSAMGFF